jgi:hypothetical protein
MMERRRRFLFRRIITWMRSHDSCVRLARATLGNINGFVDICVMA